MTIPNNDTPISRRRFLRRAVIAAAIAPLLLPHRAEAGNLFATPSIADQKKVGRQAAKQVLSQYKEIHDRRATHFADIGRRLVNALSPADRHNFDFRFHVLDSKEINAFALPGGPMFLFTGLYSQMSTDDELAAVTGHEMTHVRMQHWAKAYAKAQEREIGIAAVLTILRAGHTVQSIAGLADNAISLKYSRGEEEQADEGGLRNMVDAGFNPSGMIQLFQTLQRLAGNGGGPGGDFFSDHPLTSDRIRNAEKLIDALPADCRNRPMTPLNYDSLIG